MLAGVVVATQISRRLRFYTPEYPVGCDYSLDWITALDYWTDRGAVRHGRNLVRSKMKSGTKSEITSEILKSQRNLHLEITEKS